jgi:integrase
MLIVGMKADPVTVARQLGHSDPATTLRVYSHEFEKARNADTMRGALEQQFGALLGPSS